jgi:PilZ domain
MATRFNMVGQFKARRSARDARKSSRRTVQSQGWIRLAGDFAVRPCVIVDMSHTGARLHVETPNRVTDRFNLLLSRHESEGLRCQVKWRRGTYLGVMFV